MTAAAEFGIPWEDLTFEEHAALMARMAKFGVTEPPEEFWAGMQPHGQQVAWRANFAEEARIATREDPETTAALQPLPKPETPRNRATAQPRNRSPRFGP